MLKSAILATGMHTSLLTRVAPRASLRVLASTSAAARLPSAPKKSIAASSSRNIATTRAPTTTLSQEESLNLLNKQRSVRPSSPHFTIYQPQLTWLGSIANRVTGVGLSAVIYVYAITYLAAPYAGFADLVSSSHIADLVATAPVWLKLGLKAPLAAAASFHSLNGLRHLAWDWGYFMSIKGAYASGYAVIAASAASTVGLCML